MGADQVASLMAQVAAIQAELAHIKEEAKDAKDGRGRLHGKVDDLSAALQQHMLDEERDRRRLLMTMGTIAVSGAGAAAKYLMGG